MILVVTPPQTLSSPPVLILTSRLWHAPEIAYLKALDTTCSQRFPSLAQFNGYALDDVALRLVSELSGWFGPDVPS